MPAVYELLCSRENVKSDWQNGTFTESSHLPSSEKGHSPNDGNSTSASELGSSVAGFTTSRAHLPNTTTTSQSMMHLMKGMLGTGILAIPSACKNAGLWTGFVGLFIIAIICTHCMHQLVDCAHKLCQRHDLNELNYGKTVLKAFEAGPVPLRRCAQPAYIIINIMICFVQFGFCIVYILFIAENLKGALDAFVSPEDNIEIQIYAVIVMLVLIPLSFIKNLASLAPFSVLANVFTLLGICLIFFYCFQDLPPSSTYPAFNSWATLPMYFGTAIFAFEGIGVVLPIENKMKYPADFGGRLGVMNVTMVVTTCLYAGLGFFGYMKAGEAVAGSITLNLPKDPYYSVVKVMFALAILLTYLLQFYVPFNVLWPKIKKKIKGDRAEFWLEYIMRGSLVIVTFGIAMLVPHLELMISLVGAFASSAIAIIIPPLIDTLIRWPHDLGRYRWRLWKNIGIGTFGMIGFVAGTAVSLHQIILTFTADKNNVDDIDVLKNATNYMKIDYLMKPTADYKKMEYLPKPTEIPIF